MKNNKFFILILCLLASPLMYGQWNEMDKIVANDRQPGDHFAGNGGGGSAPSKAVSIYEDIAVVGSPNSDHGGFTDAGAVYIYQKNANCDWIQIQKITASFPANDDYFGFSVAIYGNFIVVGAPQEDEDENEVSTMNGSGSAYIFQNVSGTWVQIQKIVSPDREIGGGFGYDVDVTGRRLIVGSWGDDSGPGVPLDTNAGAAYVFVNTGTWLIEQKLVATDRDAQDWFGVAVAISEDFAIVGAHQEDNDAAGTPGSFLAASGSAYIFERNATWNQVQKVTSTDRGSGEFFGRSVDIDGNFAIVSAESDAEDETGAGAVMVGAGSAFIFERSTSGLWVSTKIDASDRAIGDQFGGAVSITHRGNAAVGAWLEDHNPLGGAPLTEAGSAYVFSNTGGFWIQTQKIVSTDRAANDRFGQSIAIYDQVILVGAGMEDEDDAPVPGNTMAESGSGYVFQNYTNPADEPTISASTINFCPGSNVVLTVTGGNLNGATDWQWYSGSCNGTIIGNGLSITVAPGGSTTYFVNGVGSCVNPGICASITLNQVGHGWHQTTMNAQGRDITKDVITDASGNVYVTGYFTKQTTLKGGFITPNKIMLGSALPYLASYVAKYSACGELLWEAHSKESGNNQGNSIVLDALHNRVCITGIFSSNLTFTSSSCSGTPLVLNATNTKGYVAAFDMNTGCIIYVNPVNIGAQTTHCEAITVNELTGDLYVGGDYSSSGTIVPSSFIARYNYLITGIGSPSSMLLSTTPANQTNRVNDMDYYEAHNSLWVIGDFRKNVQFPGALLSSPTPAVDAYLLRCSDIGGVALSIPLSRIGNSSDNMTGEGVSVDGSDGTPYITGSYRNQLLSGVNLFQESGFTLSFPGGSGYKSYMMKFWPGSSWVNTGIVNTSNANGKSVSVRNNRVYFTGTYTKAALNLTSFGSPLNYVVLGPPTNKAHSYVANYSTSGVALSSNATADPSNTDASHEAESVYTGVDGKCYVTGAYFHNLDDYTSTPTYNNLVSSGLTGHTNGFILQVNVTTSAFRESNIVTDMDESASNKGPELVNVYPNPTHGEFTVELKKIIETYSAYFTLISVDGKILTKQKINEPRFTINLSGYESGIYFVRVNNEETSFQLKIIKTD